MAKKNNETKTVKKVSSIKDIEGYKNSEYANLKIEIFINDIVIDFLNKNNKKIVDELYDIDNGIKIFTDEMTVKQEHILGKKINTICISMSNSFEEDIIKYEVCDIKEDDLNKIVIKIDKSSKVSTTLGMLIMDKLNEKFTKISNMNKSYSGAQKILDFIKKEKLNKDDLLMAISVLFDEISGNSNDTSNSCNSDNGHSDEKCEMKELVEKHSEIIENSNESSANLVKYKKSIFTKIIDWFYE